MSKKDNPGIIPQHPGMNKKTEEFIAQKQQKNRKSGVHHYPLPDKRQEARHQHINGSTPKRDQ